MTAGIMLLIRLVKIIGCRDHAHTRIRSYTVGIMLILRIGKIIEGKILLRFDTIMDGKDY